MSAAAAAKKGGGRKPAAPLSAADLKDAFLEAVREADYSDAEIRRMGRAEMEMWMCCCGIKGDPEAAWPLVAAAVRSAK